MRLLSIDPGTNFTGFSYFEDSTLVRCGVSKKPKKPMELGELCEFHWYNIPPVVGPVDKVVVERMQLRKIDGAASRLVALANDLFSLQSIGAYIAGRANAELFYVPHFKVPKAVTQARVQYLLSARELEVFAVGLGKSKKVDDLADSVALGLRAVGRMG